MVDHKELRFTIRAIDQRAAREGGCTIALLASALRPIARRAGCCQAVQVEVVVVVVVRVREMTWV